MIRIAVVILAVTLLTGCSQNVVYREYFPPDEHVKIERADGSVVGATKVEATKAGAPNWSDNKSLNISFFGL